MRKTIRQLCVLLALLVLASGAAVLLRVPATPEGDAPADPPGEPALYVLQNESGVKSAKITCEGETFTLETLAEDIAQENPRYSLRELAGYPLDNTLLSAALDTLAHLPATRLLVEQNADLALYGLAAPLVRAEIRYVDGTSATLLLGNDAPLQEGIYATLENSGAVYLVPTSPANHLRRRLVAYISRDITGGSSSSKIFEASLTGTRLEQPIVLEATDKDPASQNAGEEFRFLSPVQAKAGGQESLAVLRSLLGITGQAVAVNPSIPTLEALGLLEPYAGGQVTFDGGSFTVYASAPGEGGNIYLMLDDRPVVYTAPAEGLLWVTAQYQDMVAKTVCAPELEALSAVEVHVADSTHSFLIGGEGQDLAVEYGGNAVDLQSFQNYFGILTAAKRTTYTPLPGTLLSSFPELLVTYRYREGGEDVVQYYPGPTRQHYVMHGGHNHFLTSSTYVERVITDLAKLTAGEAVLPYT